MIELIHTCLHAVKIIFEFKLLSELPVSGEDAPQVRPSPEPRSGSHHRQVKHEIKTMGSRSHICHGETDELLVTEVAENRV